MSRIWNMPCVAFSDCLVSVSNMHPTSIHIYLYLGTLVPWYCRIVSHRVDWPHSLPVHLLKDTSALGLQLSDGALFQHAWSPGLSLSTLHKEQQTRVCSYLARVQGFVCTEVLEWVSAKEHDCWITYYDCVSFCRRLADCLLERPHCLASHQPWRGLPVASRPGQQLVSSVFILSLPTGM